MATSIQNLLLFQVNLGRSAEKNWGASLAGWTSQFRKSLRIPQLLDARIGSSYVIIMKHRRGSGEKRGQIFTFDIRLLG